MNVDQSSDKFMVIPCFYTITFVYVHCVQPGQHSYLNVDFHDFHDLYVDLDDLHDLNVDLDDLHDLYVDLDDLHVDLQRYDITVCECLY